MIAVMQEDKKTEQAPPEPEKRKPYVKPAFRQERVFETTAAACGKALPTSRCKHFKKRS
jgi:hypothetical protein